MTTMPQTQIDEAAERVKFEADLDQNFGIAAGPTFKGEYLSSRTDDRFGGWLAAKRAVLSEAKPIDMEAACRSAWQQLTDAGRKDIRYPDFRAIWLIGRDFGISECQAVPPAAEAKDAARWIQFGSGTVKVTPTEFQGSPCVILSPGQGEHPIGIDESLPLDAFIPGPHDVVLTFHNQESAQCVISQIIAATGAWQQASADAPEQMFLVSYVGLRGERGIWREATEEAFHTFTPAYRRKVQVIDAAHQQTQGSGA